MVKDKVEQEKIGPKMAIALTIDFMFSFWLAGVYLIWYGVATSECYIYIGWFVIILSVALYVLILRAIHNGR